MPTINLSEAAADKSPIFNNIDWRFLLPISSKSHVLVAGRGSDDYSRLFNKLGVTSIACCDGGNSSPSRMNEVLIKLAAQPEFASHFDAVAIPVGMPFKLLAGGVSQQIKIYRTIKELLHPKGVLLIGFSNIFGIRRRIRAGCYYSTPWYMTRLLEKAGYKSFELYGVISNLNSPDYIFPLSRHLFSFVLKHRYQYKFPSGLLWWLSNSFVAGRFLNYFPSYFVVASDDIYQNI
ncbi:MAG: hypothetical protein Q8L64_01215 [bacterium]|jgi:hypothetical protein|nr:hypothetical protein [bacterium]